MTGCEAQPLRRTLSGVSHLAKSCWCAERNEARAFASATERAQDAVLSPGPSDFPGVHAHRRRPPECMRSHTAHTTRALKAAVVRPRPPGWTRTFSVSPLSGLYRTSPQHQYSLLSLSRS